MGRIHFLNTQIDKISLKNSFLAHTHSGSYQSNKIGCFSLFLAFGLLGIFSSKI